MLASSSTNNKSSLLLNRPTMVASSLYTSPAGTISLATHYWKSRIACGRSIRTPVAAKSIPAVLASEFLFEHEHCALQCHTNETLGLCATRAHTYASSFFRKSLTAGARLDATCSLPSCVLFEMTNAR